MNKKIAIYKGYKMILPCYGEFNGQYGIFTSDGFCYPTYDEDVTDIEIDNIEYDDIIDLNHEFISDDYVNKIFEQLSNPKY